VLVWWLVEVDGVGWVDVVGLGFFNIVLDVVSAGGLARAVVEAGVFYGDNMVFIGYVVNFEFVLVNLIGFLYIGYIWWVVFGDLLCWLFIVSGVDVMSEYYVNDVGV